MMDDNDQSAPDNGEAPTRLSSSPALASSGDNIVSFHDAKPYPFTAKRSFYYCPRRCERVFVIEKTRSLECQDCKRVIDPFDYPMHWAIAGDRRLGELRELDASIKKKGAELAALKTEVTNAKAQLRRATPTLFSQKP